jgi:hypothetical protein
MVILNTNVDGIHPQSKSHNVHKRLPMDGVLMVVGSYYDYLYMVY